MRYYKAVLFLLLSVVIGMQSCKQTKSQYTPYISYSVFLRNPKIVNDEVKGAQDTIAVNYNSSLNCYVLDTINGQDTIYFMIGFGSRGNDLQAALVTIDTAALKPKYTIGDDIKKVLDSKSNADNGQLYFISGYNFVMFPTTYIAKKAGSHKITFTVKSDSKYSPVSYTFLQPVR